MYYLLHRFPPKRSLAPSRTPVSQYSTSLTKCAAWFWGPCCTDRSNGSPIFIFFVSSTTLQNMLGKSQFVTICTLVQCRLFKGFPYLSRNSSYIVSSMNNLPAAMQFSPLLKKTLPRAFLTAFSISQSAKMIRGDFPPNSREHFFKFDSAHDFIML